MEIVKGSKTFYQDKELIKKIKVNYLELKIKKLTKNLNEKLKEEKISIEILSKKFEANKTSKNGLSLFTRWEFKELVTKEQPKEIINFFKFFGLIFENKIFSCENENDFIKLFLGRTFPENSILSKILI